MLIMILRRHKQIHQTRYYQITKICTIHLSHKYNQQLWQVSRTKITYNILIYYLLNGVPNIYLKNNFNRNNRIQWNIKKTLYCVVDYNPLHNIHITHIQIFIHNFMSTTQSRALANFIISLSPFWSFLCGQSNMLYCTVWFLFATNAFRTVSSNHLLMH